MTQSCTRVLFSLLVLPFALIGCQSLPDLAALSDNEVSRIVFIRLDAKPDDWELQIEVGSRRGCKILNGQYCELRVYPGEKQVAVKWPFWASQIDLNADLNFQAGKRYFFRVDAKQEVAGEALNEEGRTIIYYNSGTELHQLKGNEAKSLLTELVEVKK